MEKNWGLAGIASGYLLGLLVNAQTDPSFTTFSGLAIGLLDFRSRPMNLLTIIALLLVVTLPILRFILRRVVSGRNYIIRLSELFKERINSDILPYHKGRIAWGPELVVQTSPAIPKGWSLNQILIKHEPIRIDFSDKWKVSYNDYYSRERLRGAFQTNKLLLSLVETPDVFSDRPELVLHVKDTLYSEIRYFKENIASLAMNRHMYLQDVMDGRISFPNSICYHMVVVTNDNYLLLTQRSNKVDVFKGMWSCSIEEQLDQADLIGREEDYALNWCERMLREELGVSRDGYSAHNIRTFAVFLETDVLNFNLAGLVILKHDRQTLDAIIDKHQRADYEFQKWDYLTWSDIPAELLSPTYKYHPSTELRLFFAGSFKYGVTGFARKLVATHNKSTAIRK